MAQAHENTWTTFEGLAWLSTVYAVNTQDAALLNHLQLSPGETGILDVGCADGTFVVSASKVVRSMTQDPVKIVGIDNCQVLVSHAWERLRAESTTDPNIRTNVEFLLKDLKDFATQSGANDIKAHFPRGISTIVVMNLLHDLSSPATVEAVRNLASLLNPGGRVVFGTVPRPHSFGSAFYVDRDRRHAGTVNLASPRFIEAAVQSAVNLSRGVAGAGPGGVLVSTGEPTAAWFGTIVEDFTRLPADDAGSSIEVNRVATFDAVRRAFYNSSTPRLVYGDSAEAFASAAANDIIPTLPSRAVSANTQPYLVQQFLGPDGLPRVQMWLATALGFGRALDSAVQHVVRRNPQQICVPHGLGADLCFQVAGAFVIITLTRQ